MGICADTCEHLARRRHPSTRRNCRRWPRWLCIDVCIDMRAGMRMGMRATKNVRTSAAFFLGSLGGHGGLSPDRSRVFDANRRLHAGDSRNSRGAAQRSALQRDQYVTT